MHANLSKGTLASFPPSSVPKVGSSSTSNNLLLFSQSLSTIRDIIHNGHVKFRISVVGLNTLTRFSKTTPLVLL